MNERFRAIDDVIADDLFPEVDTDLRAGRHVATDDLDAFEFLRAAQHLLEPHYRRWGLELTHRAEGYFFLVPTRDGVRRRQLTHAEMLAGQALALLWLDPGTLAANGVVRRDEVLRLLASLVGEDKLVARMNPRRKRRDERVDQEMLREEIQKAIRTLANLGFCVLEGEESVRVRPTIMRFADLARGPDRKAALEKLVARGEAVDGDVQDAQPAEEETP